MITSRTLGANNCKQKHAFNHVITQPWTKFPNLTYMYCILSSIFWNFFCQSKFMWLAVSLNCNLFPKQFKWPRTTFCQAYNFKNSNVQLPLKLYHITHSMTMYFEYDRLKMTRLTEFDGLSTITPRYQTLKCFLTCFLTMLLQSSVSHITRYPSRSC